MTIIAQFLRQNYDNAMAVLLYDDSSSSSDSSDEDMLHEIFVDAMFPNHKHDYPRVNIEDLSKSQCEAMFRQVMKPPKIFVTLDEHLYLSLSLMHAFKGFRSMTCTAFQMHCKFQNAISAVREHMLQEWKPSLSCCGDLATPVDGVTYRPFLGGPNLSSA